MEASLVLLNWVSIYLIVLPVFFLAKQVPLYPQYLFKSKDILYQSNPTSMNQREFTLRLMSSEPLTFTNMHLIFY